MAGGGLGGFLFGNIDEEGRLDDEELDEELKVSLTTFVEKGFGSRDLSLSFGIDEIDKDVKEECAEYEYVESECDENASSNHFYESQSANILFTSLFSLGTGPQASTFHFKKVRVKRRFLQNKSLHYVEDAAVLFRNASAPCGPMMSKHRLFLTVSSHQAGLNRRRPSIKARLIEGAFRVTEEKCSSPKVECCPETAIEVAQLHPLQVLSWEQAIIWSEEDIRPSKLTPIYSNVRNEPPVATPSAPVRPSIPRAPIVPPGVSKALSGLSHSATLSALASVAPHAVSALIAQQRSRLSPSPTSLSLGTLIKNPASRVMNTDLLKDDWIEAILYGGPEDNVAKYPISLNLNLNDPQLIVEIVDAEQEKKLTKTEKLLHKKLKKVQPSSAAGKIQVITNYSRPVVDRFNLSNDKFYEVKPAVQKSANAADGNKLAISGRSTSLQHSIPALKLLPPHFNTFREKTELRCWHRPKLVIADNQVVSFSAIKATKKKSGTRVAQVIRNSKKLTLKDGGAFVIVEFAEEFPIVMQNPGMSTHLLQYYRKRSSKDAVPADVNVMGIPSLLRVLEPTDPSPFWTFGDVPPGQSMYVAANNLYRAPLFAHNTAHSNDFLMIKSTDKNGVVKWYLRDIDVVLLAGQVFPLAEIYSPHSRRHNQFCRHRLQVAAYRLFQKDTNERKRLKAARLSKAFPQFSEGSIRKWLKEYAESLRAGKESGTWVMKEDAPGLGEDDLRALVTPEMVCLYEAMLAGQQRLVDSGLVVEEAANNDDATSVTESNTPVVSGNLSHTPSAPWNLSAAFLQTINGNGMVRLDGPGDPSGRGEMFSFVKGNPSSLQITKVTDDSSLADVFRKSRNNVELQTLYNQEKKKIWERQVKALSSKDVPAAAPGDQASAARCEHSSGHRLVLERVHVDGEGLERVEREEVCDQRVISIYLRQRRQLEIKRKRRANAVIAATASKQKKKRTLEVLERVKEPKKPVNVRCGACGAMGHMRTNRVCPYYQDPDQPSSETPAAVKVEGTKLSINAEALNRIVEQERSFKLKLPINVPPTEKPKKKRKLSSVELFLSRHPDRKSMLALFNQQLQSITERLMAEPDSWPFHRPVSRQQYPHYHKIVCAPIDLGTIKAQTSREKYLHSSEYIAKVQLMANNCLLFNRSDHVFTLTAFRLLELAKQLCEPVASMERELHSADGDIDQSIIVTVDDDDDDSAGSSADDLPSVHSASATSSVSNYPSADTLQSITGPHNGLQNGLKDRVLGDLEADDLTDSVHNDLKDFNHILQE